MASPSKAHSHYYRIIGGLKVDFYRLCEVFGVVHPAQTHALKKVMFAGRRPDEAKLKDINEAIDSLERWKEMIHEDSKLTQPK